MREIKIKVIFPYNWYQIRKIKIKDNKGLVASIPVNTESSISIDDSVNELFFSLDYYRKKITLSTLPENNTFIVLYFKLGNNKILHIVEGIIPSSFSAELLNSEEEYNSRTYKTYYFEKKEENIRLDYLSLILGAISSVLLILSSIIFFSSNDWMYELAVIFGFIGLLTIIAIIVDKKKISKSSYKSRLILLSVPGIIISFFLSVSLVFKFILTMSFLIIFTRTIGYSNT